MRRRIIAGIAVLILAFAVDVKIAAVAASLQTILVVLPSDRNPFWIDVATGAKQASEELKGRYVVDVIASRDQDAQSQSQILRSALARNEATALVLGPASDTETVPVLQQYYHSKIPIVDIDTPLNPNEMQSRAVKVASFIGSDNVEGGQLAAQQMAKVLEGQAEKRVLILEGSLVHQSAIDRTKGFVDEAKVLGLDTIVIGAEWKRDRAQSIVESQFRRAAVQGIFAENDDMALGAIAGLQNLNATPNTSAWPVLIGFDATADAISAIKESKMNASIKQNPERLGHDGVILAARILQGDSSVPTNLLMPITVVTKNNVN